MTSAAAVVHVADSESGSLTEWPYSDGSPNLSQMCCTSQSATYLSNDSANGGPSQARAGSKFLRLSRYSNQPLAPVPGNGNRVEVSAAGFHVEKHMQDAWIGFSVYVPSNLDTSKIKAWRFHSIFQWHDTGPHPGVLQGMLEGDNDFRITSRSYNGKPPQDWWNHMQDVEHLNMKMPRDQWVDFVFRVHWDHRPLNQGGNGELEVWMNGERVVAYNGPIGFGHDYGGKSTYFKAGSYAADDNPFDRVLYYDEVRFGDQNSSFQEVSPSQQESRVAVPAAPTLSIE